MRKWLFILPLILLTGVGLLMYWGRTMEIDTPKGVVDIVHPRGVIDNGLLTRTYYMEYKLMPTELTEPDIVYRVIVDNGLVKQEDKVMWSNIELGIGQAKPISHRISQTEFVALGMSPQYAIVITEVRSERDANYLMWPVLYLGGLFLLIVCGVSVLGKPRRKRFKGVQLVRI